MDSSTQIQVLLEENTRLKGEIERLRFYIQKHKLPGPIPPPFRIPFAGEGSVPSPDSVLSHCYGALLPMFDTKEATVLRLLCREFKDTVSDYPWEDDETVILGSVAAWRACFPRARWANVTQNTWLDGRSTPIVDADFVHFVGLSCLDISGCTRVTDAAFVHLKGIHKLNMSNCRQSAITDSAFTHLKGIHTLNMAACRQATITDAAIAHLKGIHSLSVYECTQLTSAVFAHLKGVKELNIGWSRQLNLTDDSLKGIEWLNMFGHSQAQFERVESLGYPVNQTPTSGV